MHDPSQRPSRRSWLVIGLIAGLAQLGLALPAQASEGYFQNGIGARHKALAGAGVADGRDATAAALNPAGLVHAPNEASLALSILSPRREFEGSGGTATTNLTPTGVVESDGDFFFYPNLALSFRLPANAFVDVIGVTLYSNGGMKTDYPAVARSAADGGGFGVFNDGRAGLHLRQDFLSVAFAKQFDNVAFGVAPILARQQFSADGLFVFTGSRESSTAVAWGYGARAGAEMSISPGVRIAAAGTSRIYMPEFDKYATFLAEQGDFDIPPSAQAGVAVDVTANLTLMADYRHIWFSDIRALANPSPTAANTQFGANNGPGFGWRDVNIFKLGVEWRKSADLTWRAGYSYNTSPILAADAMINILTPQVVQHHFSGGLEYRFGPSWSLEAAIMFAPQGSARGVETDFAPTGTDHNIELRMWQAEATAGIKYRF